MGFLALKSKLGTKGARIASQRLQVIVVFLGLCLLAASLPGVQFAPTDWSGLERAAALGSLVQPAKEFLRNVGVFLLVFAPLSGAFLLLALIRRPRRRKKKDDDFVVTFVPQRPWALLLLALFWLCLGVGVWWLWQSGIGDELVSPRSIPSEMPVEIPPLSSSVPVESPLPESPEILLPWVGYLLSAGALLFAAGLIWRKRGKPLEEESLETIEMKQAAAEAIADLNKGKELSDVILRCYRDMYRILESRVWNSQSATAREFAEHLAKVGVSAPEVASLTTLFETVRYGRRLAGPTEKKDALAALEAIRCQYGKNEGDAI